MNFVPVLQLPPLELLPPSSLPSELDLVRLFFGRSPKPSKVVRRKATCPVPGDCEEIGKIVKCETSRRRRRRHRRNTGKVQTLSGWRQP